MIEGIYDWPGTREWHAPARGRPRQSPWRALLDLVDHQYPDLAELVGMTPAGPPLGITPCKLLPPRIWFVRLAEYWGGEDVSQGVADLASGRRGCHGRRGCRGRHRVRSARPRADHGRRAGRGRAAQRGSARQSPGTDQREGCP